MKINLDFMESIQIYQNGFDREKYQIPTKLKDWVI